MLDKYCHCYNDCSFLRTSHLHCQSCYVITHLMILLITLKMTLLCSWHTSCTYCKLEFCSCLFLYIKSFNLDSSECMREGFNCNLIHSIMVISLVWVCKLRLFPSFYVKFVIHLDCHLYVILAPPHGLIKHTTQVQLILVALIECIAQNSATRETVSLVESAVTRCIYTHRQMLTLFIHSCL